MTKNRMKCNVTVECSYNAITFNGQLFQNYLEQVSLHYYMNCLVHSELCYREFLV